MTAGVFWTIITCVTVFSYGFGFAVGWWLRNA
jgi:hypothetical protein